MSYYIFPNKNIMLDISPTFISSPLTPIVSFSLIYYLNELYNQISNLTFMNEKEFNIDFFYKIIK